MCKKAAREMLVFLTPVRRKEPYRIKLLFEQDAAPDGKSGEEEYGNDDNHFDRSFHQEIRIS